MWETSAQVAGETFLLLFEGLSEPEECGERRCDVTGSRGGCFRSVSETSRTSMSIRLSARLRLPDSIMPRPSLPLLPNWTAPPQRREQGQPPIKKKKNNSRDGWIIYTVDWSDQRSLWSLTHLGEFTQNWYLSSTDNTFTSVTAVSDFHKPTDKCY